MSQARTEGEWQHGKMAVPRYRGRLREGSISTDWMNEFYDLGIMDAALGSY